MKNSNERKKIISTGLTYLVLCVLLSSCLADNKANSRGRSTSSVEESNPVVPVGVFNGKVLLDNPVILSNYAAINLGTDLNKYTSEVKITESSKLEGAANCTGLTYCFEVRDNNTSISSLQTFNGQWGFRTKSNEFLQVNTYYHINKAFDRFLNNLSLTKDFAFNLSGGLNYRSTSIPYSIYGTSTIRLHNRAITAFSNCDEVDNAYYSAATYSLCFGYTGQKKELRWAHDSTVIYHELGHFIQDLQLNLRNSSVGPRAQMGNFLFNEAGALGEGLSDYYSYYINGRAHFGEWAAGNLQASRPLSEDDNLHIPALAANDQQRLKYPDYLTYDPNHPQLPYESVHTAGMIISHYLVALTTDIQSKCNLNNLAAREIVMIILNETLAELGDLTSVGSVGSSGVVVPGKINLNATTLASTWLKINNPINYRSFSQTIAQNLYKTFVDTSSTPLQRVCSTGLYTKQDIEALLDSYGLLLFRSYNHNRNFSNPTTNPNILVDSTNRKLTTLIPKSSLILDPDPETSDAFIIDNRTQIYRGIQQLKSAGIITDLSTQTPPDLGYNNGNNRVSPGEVVAIIPNLYNDSNSTMGGIQVLANDWNHVDTGINRQSRPCQYSSISGTKWPSEGEGGSLLNNCNPNSPAPTTDPDPNVNFAPVCFIQSTSQGATRWVSQKEYMEDLNLDSNLCLGQDPRSCFIRAIKGADNAYFSKINPKSTWGKTMANPETGEAYSPDWGNVLLFEVSKHLNPGTEVNCRLRVRFTNCDDCFHDNTSPQSTYDYHDRMYNEHKPFSIINLLIPIRD